MVETAGRRVVEEEHASTLRLSWPSSWQSGGGGMVGCVKERGSLGMAVMRR